MTTLAMLPCPFCGNESPSHHGLERCYVLCGNCGAEGPVMCSTFTAIDAWNKAPRGSAGQFYVTTTTTEPTTPVMSDADLHDAIHFMMRHMSEYLECNEVKQQLESLLALRAKRIARAISAEQNKQP